MARHTKLYEVYLCKTPMARHPGKFHTSHVAVGLDALWLPIDPYPSHAVRSLGRFLAKSKGDAIRDALSQEAKS